MLRGQAMHPAIAQRFSAMIRDGLEEVTDVFGFDVRRLLEGCLEARLDLDEDDEQWIALRWVANPQDIQRKFAGRLMRCARALNVIEQEWQPRQYREPELIYDSGAMVFKAGRKAIASGSPRQRWAVSARLDG
jgi:hypothetical protein